MADEEKPAKDEPGAQTDDAGGAEPSRDSRDAGGAEAETKAKPDAEAEAKAKADAEGADAEKKDEPEAEEKSKPEAEEEKSAKDEDEPAAAAEKSAAAEDKPAPSSDEGDKAAWGAPLAKLDRAWTALEARLCAAVLVAEIVTLVFWIGIRALSATGREGPGMIFRVLLTAAAFGVVAHLASKKHPRHEIITTAATLTGAVLGTRWGEAGTTYFSNLFAWLQNSSILVFFGGVSELAKRLTLWLALLGASLATAQGKHINVDFAMRFLKPKARVPVAVIGWLAAAVVSISASWGFFDYVCVEELRAPPTIACPDDETKRCPAPPGTKFEKVMSVTRRNMFLAGRQLSLDLRSLPKVLTGTPYNQWMTPQQWNEWLRGGDWDSHFKTEDWKAFELPEDGSIDFRNPSVTAIPGGTEAIPKLLVPLLNLVFAWGLFVIGIRFILRSLLALAGWVKVDPAAAHGDDDLAHAHDHSPEAEMAEARMKETHS